MVDGLVGWWWGVGGGGGGRLVLVRVLGVEGELVGWWVGGLVVGCRWWGWGLRGVVVGGRDVGS